MEIDTNGFEIGDRVRDKVTGFSGVITGITQWTTGCARAVVQPALNPTEPHKIPEGYSIDVLTLSMIEKGPRHAKEPAPEAAASSRKGGPPTATARP